MKVANAHAFLEFIKKDAPSPALLSKVCTYFTAEHMVRALQERGSSKDKLLKVASGDSSKADWISATAAAAGSAAAGAKKRIKGPCFYVL